MREELHSTPSKRRTIGAGVGLGVGDGVGIGASVGLGMGCAEAGCGAGAEIETGGLAFHAAARLRVMSRYAPPRAALGSMGVSAVLQATGKRHASLFVGQWAPAFLLLGVYNKLVKQLGSDQYDPA